MSLIRPALNAWLRWTEKPFLARVEDVEEVRAAFERSARLYFHPPFGTQRRSVKLGNVPTLEITSRRGRAGPTLLYFHGGAYVFGSPNTHAAMLARLLREVGGAALLPDYRKAPDHPFPAAVEDAATVWRALPKAGVAANQVILGGDSAGGGLALALLGHILDHDLPRPAGLFAFSPWTDLTLSGGSFQRNAEADALLPAHRAREMAEMYLGGHGGTDPRASPLFADFRGAPPVWLTVGETEILHDDSARLAERLARSGVDVTYTTAWDLPHVWPIFHNILPEARVTLRDLGQWIRQQMVATGES